MVNLGKPVVADMQKVDLVCIFISSAKLFISV